MLVLLTNDDGIFAPGLSAMRAALEAQGDLEVFVIAPDRERSACGHAITMHKPLMVERVQLRDGKSPGYLVAGTPADCVKLGVEALLSRAPDLVISGINRGQNLGTDVFYSGTVSAAIEGAILGIPSMAISLATWEDPDYSLAASFGSRLALRVLTGGLPPSTLLNVNVPARDRSEINGVCVTRLGVLRYINVFDKRVDPRGRVYYWMAGQVDEVSEEGTDDWAIKHNMVSVTPVQLDLTAHEVMEYLKGWDLSI